MSSRNPLILFADDDLGAYETQLSEYFSKARPEWRIVFARTPDDAREEMNRERPDAVVLDVELTPGGREGLELLFEIRRLMPGTPVVLLTGVREAVVIRDTFMAQTFTEDFQVQELDPEGFLFKEEILETDRFEALESQIATGLFKYGRVPNPTGILITHGTDTMAWALCYLRYALKDLTANVAVTGSQVPLEGYFSSSDALGNLKTAAYLLNRLRPARLFAVFNDGRHIFSGRLTKYRKWDADAFDGRVAASADADGVQTLRKDWVFIPYEDQRLRDLHLVRTGGTIECARDALDFGGLKPTGDFVWKYLNDALSGLFVNAHRHDLESLDSSNMSYEHWANIATEVERIGVAAADTAFDPGVKPVFANPLFTTADYRAQFAACGAGAVFAGFGGGNGNVLDGSPHAVLPALRESVDAGTFVAITSQVPLEPYDAEYETGIKLLEAGGVPCGDLPLTDAQVKLSYLLGHREILERTAGETGLEVRHLLTTAFLSGVTMRKARAVQVFQGLAASRGRPLKVLAEDPFVANRFDVALRVITETCLSSLG